MTHLSTVGRLGQVRRLLKTEGAAGLVDRARNQAAGRLQVQRPGGLPVSRAEFARAGEQAARGWPTPPPMSWTVGKPLTVAWICTPAGPGSGGHTTIFRMVDALQRAGHRCVVYIRDRHAWPLQQHRERIRQWWPWLDVEIRDFNAGVADAHAVFATSWETAWALAGVEASGARCYFVQDFEPSFYPAGSEYLMAEATYRFPYNVVSAGRWLSDVLSETYGVSTQHFDFGYDLENYRCDPTAERNAVSYYCRPSTARRAHELAMVALELFAAAHPDVDIHFYGESAGRVGFRHVHHGLLDPEQLCALYNRSVAGLVLSATNVSLVPYEMLAAGCIPVVNDAPQNRLVLDNDHIAFCDPLPHAIASTLSDLVSRPSAGQLASAQSASNSVRSSSWEHPKRQFVGAVEAIVGGVSVSSGGSISAGATLTDYSAEGLETARH